MREEREQFPIKESKTDVEEAFNESLNLSPEEIEEEILAVDGAEQGEGLEQLRKKTIKEERKRKRTIH